MSSAPFDQRLNRVENDVTALYDMIGDIQAKLLEHDVRFDSVDSRLGSVDSRLGSVDSRLGSVEEGVAEILRRLPEAS